MKNYIQTLSQKLFSSLLNGEELSLLLHSEESRFIRLSQAKVRQNTEVYQHELTLQYQCNQRTYKSTFNLILDEKTDTDGLLTQLQKIRAELPLTDENPQYTPLENNGVSEIYKKSDYPTPEQFMQKIEQNFAGQDLVGLYCAGPIRSASINSKGQFHYFENDHFFFDYSLYDGPRAAKGYYSEEKWSDTEFASQAQAIKNTLSLLKKPKVHVKPGLHRTYLAPMAAAELAEILSWGAMSRGAFERGFTPLKKLFTKEQLMSPKFSLIENNELGLNSHFNNNGEISPKYLPLIENGQLKNFLVSTATAKEYGLTSNQAGPGERMRSFEIRAGTLKEADILKQLGTGLYLTNLHYLNWSDPQAARLTGMTRFACFWVENGEIIGPIQDLRFDDNLYRLYGSEVIEFTEQRSTYISTSTYQKRAMGGLRVPGMLLASMNFTL